MPDTSRLATALGDRYVIERELGAGGMATVYLAKDLKHDREVALKVLRPELGAVLGSERFLAEIRITARLDHPHILTLIDSGESAGLLWYVLPYVRGESLRDLLNREKQLSLEQALTITKQVASALAFAHQHGVVHRDIKPENILLLEGEAMLADFGIALAVKEAGGNRLTETGLSLGTPQYMSPEQATGDRALDARSDVYSLAAVLYEMLAGEPPVTGATAQAMIAKLMTERPTHLRVVRDTVPEGIDNAVNKALSKVPADRFVGAAEFAAALVAGAAAPRSSAAGSRSAKQKAPMIIAIAVAVAVLGVAAERIVSKVIGGGVRVVQQDRVQVTSTGNARTPALSPDGQRMAFSVRQCTADGYCTVDVVVQDVGGAGANTVLRGWAAVWDIEWTSDARYLLVNGFEHLAGRWGAFSVPSLGGGTSRWLGGGIGNIGAGDTALVSRGQAGDSLFWIRWVTMADGVAHDSIAVPRPPGSYTVAAALGAGPLLGLVRDAAVSQTVFIAERDGRLRDSLVLDRRRYSAAGFTPDGGAILVRQEDAAGTGAFDLLAYAVGSDGRIGTRADTVLRQLNGEVSLARNGMLVNAAGPTDRELWLLRRDAPTSMRFTQRRLAASTTPMGGLVSPDGERMAIWRRLVQGGVALSQITVMPSDSGAEVPVGPPVDHADWEWTADSHGLVMGVFRGDSVDVKTQQIPSGRTTPLVTLSREEFGNVWALPGGGAIISPNSGLTLRIVGVPGRRDTVLSYPESDGSFHSLAPSPDGREVVTLGWDGSDDSIQVRRVSLETGVAVRLWTKYADGSQPPMWFRDGTLLVPVRETASTLVWYRMPVSGGRPVRLGTPPRATDATFRMSSDGGRVVARVNSTRSDIFIIRNFAEMLPR